MLNDLVEQFGIVPQCIDGMRATPDRSAIYVPSMPSMCHLCATYGVVRSEASVYAAQRTQHTRDPGPNPWRRNPAPMRSLALLSVSLLYPF